LDAVYQVCLQTYKDGADGTDVFSQPDLIPDKHVGPFLSYTPEMCFVVEDYQGICGYVLAAPDARSFFDRVESSWIPMMKTKYQRSETMDTASPVNEIVREFHSYKTVAPPDGLLGKHPSVLRVDVLRDRIGVDPTAPVRALACAVAALKMTGSCGVYTRVTTGDRVTHEAYRRLGFFEMPNQLQSATEGLVHLARVI
jgi:protein O-GlcNAcase/histone acetyltransferase